MKICRVRSTHHVRMVSSTLFAIDFATVYKTALTTNLTVTVRRTHPTLQIILEATL
jgi:hypothetical protein